MTSAKFMTLTLSLTLIYDPNPNPNPIPCEIIDACADSPIVKHFASHKFRASPDAKYFIPDNGSCGQSQCENFPLAKLIAVLLTGSNMRGCKHFFFSWTFSQFLGRFSSCKNIISSFLSLKMKLLKRNLTHYQISPLIIKVFLVNIYV